MNSSNPTELIHRISRLHTALLQHGAACCGLESLTRCHILAAVGHEREVTLAELTRRLDLDKAWLSRTIDDLARQGLIEKRKNDTDRRTLLLALTPQGQQRATQLERELHAQFGRVLSRIPATERPGILRALHLLAGALENELDATTHALTCCTTDAEP